MTDIVALKDAARRAGLARRKVAHGSSESLAAQATHRLLACLAPALAGSTVVSGYLPIRTEIDPRPAMTALFDLGHRVCVPVVEGAGRPLRFRIWSPDCVLVSGAFGASIPETGAWVEPSVLIVPLVAFDGQCRRLGYGGGFYDRTLAGLRARHETRAFGFAYDTQQDHELPVDAFDQTLDAVITEYGVYGDNPN